MSVGRHAAARQLAPPRGCCCCFGLRLRRRPEAGGARCMYAWLLVHSCGLHGGAARTRRRLHRQANTVINLRRCRFALWKGGGGGCGLGLGHKQWLMRQAADLMACTLAGLPYLSHARQCAAWLAVPGV